MVADHDHLVGVAAVGDGIAERTAGGRAGYAVCVAHAVAGGRGDERDVDVYAPRINGGGTAAVAAENDGLFENTLRYCAGDLPVHIVGFNAGDHARFDMVDQRIMAVKQGACLQRQIFDAHGRDLGQHHVEHKVAVAQVVVEGDRHPVL